MKIEKLGPDFTGSWTRAIQSSSWHEFIPGTPHAAFGAALLWYKPEHRLSVSIWSKSGAINFRLWGPRKLSWERR